MQERRTVVKGLNLDMVQKRRLRLRSRSGAGALRKVQAERGAESCGGRFGGSIPEFRLSLNRISAPCQGLHDLFDGGPGLVKDHSGPVGRCLGLPIHGVVQDPFRRLEDKPYPVRRVPSAAAQSERDSNNHSLHGSGGCPHGQPRRQKKNCQQEEQNDILVFHKSSFS